jgi:hypothetical protein
MTKTSTGMAQLSKFDGSTSWAVFQCQVETIAEHNCWTPQESDTYLIAALQGWPPCYTESLKGVTYQETLEALEQPFEDQQLAAACHHQLKTRLRASKNPYKNFTPPSNSWPTAPTLHYPRTM